MPLKLRGEIERKLTIKEFDDNLIYLESLALSPGPSDDCGDILDNIILTGTQSETILYSFKIPANFYKVGDMMTIGPAVVVWGGYDENGEAGYMGPFVISNDYTYNKSGLPILGYANQTLTFSTTTNDAAGLVVSITFDAEGDFELENWTIVNPGDGYRAGETITFEDLGSGTFEILIGMNTYNNDPQARIRAYWSYDENGLDNFAEEMTLDYYFSGWKHLFNVCTASYTEVDWSNTPANGNFSPSFLPAVSKIIDKTTVKYIPNQNQSPPFNFVIATASIPDITKDIYITLTGELENSSTMLTLGFIKAIKRITVDELFGHGSQLNQTLTIDPFREFPINTFQSEPA